MQAKLTLLSLTAILSLVGAVANAAVGYVNYPFQAGDNLFGNPLDNQPNLLNDIIPAAPSGSTVLLWDIASRQFTTGSVFSSGAWSLNLSLAPGQGALLNTPSPFTNTFVGGVLNPDGSSYHGDPVFPPPPFAGPNGVYLLSSKLPALLSPGTLAVFDYILGRGPHEGEQFTSLDAPTQTYHTTTFFSGAWNNGVPVLGVGQAAFFNLGPVPEPSCLALALVGLLAAFAARHRR